MDFPLKQRPFSHYRGRFAPSPSGHLHFGSLIAALASFLDAKSNQGYWLVRIEDIDPPREQPGASAAILSTLDALGLHWDEPVLYQSQQSELYLEILSALANNQLSYFCQCTRADIKALNGIYQGHCRTLKLEAKNSAVRLINNHPFDVLNDIIQGTLQFDRALAQEDFTLLRKDGLFAYQLAVVVDDIYQGITHIIRGSDLLQPTARQLTLYQTLNCQAPVYGHVPVAITSEGFKLSKQNKAPPISHIKPQTALLAALSFLGQQPPSSLAACAVAEIIAWATEHWSLAKVPKKQQLEFQAKAEH